MITKKKFYKINFDKQAMLVWRGFFDHYQKNFNYADGRWPIAVNVMFLNFLVIYR